MAQQVTSEELNIAGGATATNSKFEFSNYYLRELGILGYLGVQAIVYPLERIKILQQVDMMPEVLDENGKYLQRQNLQAYYERHLESDTFEAFYRGLGAKLTKLVAKELSIYTIAERIRNKIQVFDAREDPFKHASYNMISAALSSMLIETLVYPIELAKTRIVCDGASFDSRVYTNIYQALTKDAASSNTTVFHGAMYSLLGVAIYRGTQIGLYETIYNLGLKDWNPLFQLPVSVLLTIFAQKIAYPIDTIRRQLMLKNTPFEVSSAELETIVKRMSHPARQKDLMRGWNMQFYKSISTGIFLFAYKAIAGTINSAPDLITKFNSI